MSFSAWLTSLSMTSSFQKVYSERTLESLSPTFSMHVYWGSWRKTLKRVCTPATAGPQASTSSLSSTVKLPPSIVLGLLQVSHCLHLVSLAATCLLTCGVSCNQLYNEVENPWTWGLTCFLNFFFTVKTGRCSFQPSTNPGERPRASVPTVCAEQASGITGPGHIPPPLPSQVLTGPALPWFLG